MKFITLNLHAFGKFQNKTIELKDGLNLIYGGNEAGKSTIQHFIEGMLFGFYKPYRKKRAFNENYEKYKPRRGDKYYGSMIVEDDLGKRVRIERDFLKTRDGVRIFDERTGEDISANYPYDQVTKQYLPLGYTQINSVVYNNTVNIKQMSSKSEKELAAEVNNRLVESVQKSEDHVAVSAAVDYIKQKREALGSSGKSKFGYGLAIRKKESLEHELVNANKVYDEVRASQKKIQYYDKQIAAAEAKKRQYDLAVEAKKAEAAEKVLSVLKENEKQAETLKAENEQLINQLKSSEKGGYGVDNNTYLRLQVLNEKAKDAETKRVALYDELGDLNNAEKEHKRRIAHLNRQLGGLTLTQLEADEKAYYVFSGKKPKIESKTIHQSGQKNFNLPDFGLLLGLGILAGVLGLVMLVLGVMSGTFGVGQIMMLLSGILLILLGAGVIWYAVKNDNIHQKEKVPDISKEAILSEKTSMDELLAAYHLTHPRDFLPTVEKLKDVFGRLESLNSQYREITFRLNAIEKEDRDLKEEKETIDAEIDEILKKSNFTSIEEYGQAVKVNDRIESLQTQIDMNKRQIESLSDKTYIAVDGEYLAGTDLYDSEESVLSEKKAEKDILEFKHEKDIIQRSNTKLLSEVRNPVVIREEIDEAYARISEYETEMQACELAESILVGFQKESHAMGADELNHKIGEILYTVTNKYKEVKVDDALNVRIIEPETGELIGIGQLSGGTIDQIYFALRFGVRDIVDGKRSLPFVLDDPFVQYDDSRKQAALKFVSRISEDNQVLLLTCTNSEKQILDDIAVGYNGVGLV